ncbi:fra a 1-associated protein-like [Nymphaea colorata]|nr:fra a 1-associated protein-like [Nymphaea colorata]
MDEEKRWRRRTGDEGFRGIGEGGDVVEVGGSGDRCSMRRVVKNHCWTEEVDPGNFVRKCEKTQQLLRKCVGRPVEVVESDTEYSEENVTYNTSIDSLPYESSNPEPFTFPGLRSDLEFLEQGIVGSFSRFIEAAEEMKNYFQSLSGFSRDWESRNRSTKSADGPFEIPISDSEDAGKSTDV